jgi:glycosyltransferase involved in cell wall biosynthesis
VSGRIAPSKRLETIVAAFRAIAARHHDAELCIAGTVEERHAPYARGLLESAGTLPVRFSGEGAGLGHLDQEFTAAIVLGTHQGSPNAVLEAMAAGIAVIANDSGGTRELVTDGVTGWLLAEEAGADALAGAMHDAIAHPREREARAAKALERVRARHSLEAMARDYLALLDAGSVAGREKMDAWNIASAPVAPLPSCRVPSPETAAP